MPRRTKTRKWKRISFEELYSFCNANHLQHIRASKATFDDAFLIIREQFPWYSHKESFVLSGVISKVDEEIPPGLLTAGSQTLRLYI